MQLRTVLTCLLVLISPIRAMAQEPPSWMHYGENVRLVGQIGGWCGDIESRDDLAYLAEGRRLTILDVSDAQAPRPLGKLALPLDRIGGLALSGDTIFAAEDPRGSLAAVDVSNPAVPILRCYWESPLDSARHIAAAGQFAVVAGTEKDVTEIRPRVDVYDLSDPTSPVLTGAYAPQDTWSIYGLAIQGTTAYILRQYLEIVDLSDPTSPILVSRTATTGVAWGLHVADDLAYVAVDPHSGLRIFDVSNPTTPVLVGLVGTTGAPRSVHVSGGIAALGGYALGRPSILSIVDVNEPATPTLLGSIEMPEGWAKVSVTGDKVLASMENSGLHVIDISSPTTPTLASLYDPPRSAHSVFVEDNRAYVVDLVGSDLHVLDVTTSSQPLPLGSCEILRGSWMGGFYVSGTTAYLCASDLQIFDVSDPRAPVRQFVYDMEGIEADVAVSGNVACVASMFGGLHIVDVTDPTSPVLRGTFETPLFAMNVDLCSPTAYVVSMLPDATSYALQLVDITDPGQPVLIGSHPIGGEIHVSGGLAYVGSSWDGLSIIDVTDPAAPRLVGSWQGPGGPVHVDGGRAYVVSDVMPEQRLRVVDVRNRTEPVLLGFFEVGRYAGGGDVFASGGRAFFASGNEGLWIVEYEAPFSATARRWELY